KNGDEKPNEDTGPKTNEEPKDQEDQAFLEELERVKKQEKKANDAAEAFRKDFAQFNTISTPISTANPLRVFNAGGPDLTNNDQVADFTNLETTINVSPIPTSRIHSIHPTTQTLRDPTSAVQTRSKVNKSSRAHAFVSYIQKQRRNNHKDFHHCLFACFLSQIEPKKISQALKDKSWVDAMQEELLQFKIQKVHRQEEGIDYDEVFAPVSRIEAIRIFLSIASYMGFIVYQMDVKNAFLYGTIDEEVYVSQPLGFVDPKFPKKSGYRRGTIDKTFSSEGHVNDIYVYLAEEDGIFISQDKYVEEILKKFDFDSVKTASTLIETQKPLIKDEEAADVDVHIYRSMIGSLMYLTASRADIMYAVCACSRFQVTSKTSHLHAVKRIFRYLKGKPKLGLWYPRVSSFDLEAYSDSDYAGANLDRKSTTGGCQFLGRRLILWQCKKLLWASIVDSKSNNLVFHSKTKHIKIRHHFIRDAYEKKLIQVLKIHTDDNVADLLTKAFDVSRFNFLIVNIGMINL
ncbi:putative ribonuclease H-like domain-containing protein, partial [Tanacetum coccineum]